MTQSLYIQPITTVSGPQAVEGEAMRLGGGMVYAREFAVIVREGGRVLSRQIATKAGMADVLASLPDALAEDASAQWAGLAKVHAPLALGGRTIRLDQPQVMGILNVTPDSFSDGGKFMDDPDSMHRKDVGVTPPNVYTVRFREKPFHGVRALRMTPVGGANMYGRDGFLTHSFLLGTNGE